VPVLFSQKSFDTNAFTTSLFPDSSCIYKPKTNAADDQLVFNSISRGSSDFRNDSAFLILAHSKGRFSHIGFTNNGYRNTFLITFPTAKESISRLRTNSIRFSNKWNGRQIRHLLPQSPAPIGEAKFNNSSRNLAILENPRAFVAWQEASLSEEIKSATASAVTNQVFR
jgi:hypothetical protein